MVISFLHAVEQTASVKAAVHGIIAGGMHLLVFFLIHFQS